MSRDRMSPSSTPLVSFVVPCYNYAHHLGQCLDSILCQIFEDFEVLVMDDCSPDNTGEVVQQFQDPRINYFRQTFNTGGCPNLNDGLRRARGTFVWPVSADDYLAREDALADYVNLLERYPDAGFAFAAPRVCNETGADIAAFWQPSRTVRRFETGELLPNLLRRCFFIPSGIIMRKDALHHCGYWSENPSIRYCPDWYLFSRLAMFHPSAFCPNPTAVYRIHPKSEVRNFARENSRMPHEHNARMLLMLRADARAAGKRLAEMECMLALGEIFATHLFDASLGIEAVFPTEESIAGFLANEGIQEPDICQILETARKQIPVRQMIYHVSLGDKALQKRQPGDAVTHYKAALNACPSHPRLRYRVWLAYFQRFTSFPAWLILKQARKMAPRSPLPI